MALAEQMRVELIDIVELLATDVALPGIALAVAALVQEVECLVGELDATEVACKYLFAIQQQITLLPSRCDCSIANGCATVAIMPIATGCVAATAIGCSHTHTHTGKVAIAATAAVAAIHHVLRHILQFVLQRRRIPRDPIVRLGADASLQILAQQRFQWRDLRGARIKVLVYCIVMNSRDCLVNYVRFTVLKMLSTPFQAKELRKYACYLYTKSQLH